MRHLLSIAGLALLLGAAACTVPLEADPDATLGKKQQALTQSVTYVGKQTTTDFTGLGQHLQYWPLFGRSSAATARRTDDEDCIELTPDFGKFKHHYLPDGRTFSNDALGLPIGTKTRGGYAGWPVFTLPDGTSGISGTFYDESNIDNSNNTVNLMRINVSTLHEFCLNLITDNTNGQHNADVRFEARSDTVDVNLAGHEDLSFDGLTDMYTFRYQGMEENDVFKIRLQCSSASNCQGAGLGGIMVSHISTCTESADADAGPVAQEPDAAPIVGSNDAGTGTTDPDGSESGCGCQSGGSGSGGLPITLLLLGLFWVGYRHRVKRLALLISLCFLASCGDDSTGQMSGASSVGQSCDIGTETDPGAIIIASPALGCEEKTCLRYPGTTDQCTARCEMDSDCEGDIDTECSGGFVCATPVVTGPRGCQSFCVCQDANPDTALPSACQ